jgi:hypothetical protein
MEDSSEFERAGNDPFDVIVTQLDLPTMKMSPEVRMSTTPAQASNLPLGNVNLPHLMGGMFNGGKMKEYGRYALWLIKFEIILVLYK